MKRTKKKTVSRKKKTVKKQKGGNKTKVYVINLKKRTDRKEKMIEKFKNSIFDLEFIEGIETSGDSHRGIGASFKKIVQMAKDNKLESVLIFEDDTKPEEHMDRNWTICKKWLDSNRDKWEVFFGGARTDDHNKTINIVETLEHDIKLVNFSYNLTLNWTYLNSSAYDKLLEWIIEKYGPIDTYLGNINYFNNLVSYPFLGLQESDVSDSWGSYQNLTSNVKLIKDVFKKAINEKSGGAYNLKDITISILSWKSCKTLKNSLESYKKNKLFDLIESFIYFQEIGDVEKKLADKYGISYIGTLQNIGIQKALIEMINHTKTPYFIFAENDFELVHTKDEMQKVFEDSIKLLEENNVQIVKLRDIQNPGEPLYSKGTYESGYKNKDNQQEFPYKLEALSYVENPETVFPNVYEIINYNYKWYKCSNKHNKWSNNIFMAKTEYMKNVLLPLLNKSHTNSGYRLNGEDEYTSELTNFNLAAGMGLFKHNRLERGGCTIDDIQSGGFYKYGGNRNNRGLDDTRRRKERKQKGGSSKIHYITVSTEKNDKLERLINSAKRFNISIEVLGLEMNTSNLGHNNNAKFGMKLRYPLEYLNKIDPNDLVLFTDAWDVVYISNEDEILKRYKEFNKPVVFGAELFCWPDNDKESLYTDTKDRYFKYLNSGLYIGPVKIIKELLENYKGGENIDDQRFWVDLYMKNKDKIVLDTENKIFLNTAGTDKNDFDFNNGVFTFKKTNSNPLVVHSNSNDKTYLDLVFQKTYVINLAERTDRKNDMIEKFKHTVFDLEFIEGVKHNNGFLGCSLSIQKVIQKAKDMNLKTVLFFEDDNKPLDDYETRWNITKQWLDNNLDKWDIFNGGARVRKEYLDSVKLIQSLNKDVNLFQADLILNTNWIYVNSRAYDKILAWKLEDNPSILCIDNFMGDKNHFNVLFIYPFLGFQESGKTNTEKNVVRDYAKNEKTRIEDMDLVLNKLKQTGGSDNIIYIKKANIMENEYLYPILKNVFPNKKIEFVNNRDSYDLVLKSHWDDGANGSNKYVFISPERYDATQTYAFNDPNCIAKIFTTQDSHLASIKDSFYIPYFLDNGPSIFETSPMKREYVNNTRTNLAAYVAGYSPEHRDKMFKALYDLDESKTTHGLGKANHTTDKDIPVREKWWELSTVYKDYLFGFAMENTNEDGYITEKIMNVYRGGAIPIYWGTSKVKDIFNTESFIYVNDYPSYEDCAKDIIAISKNKERLERMQNAPIFNTNSVIDYSKYFDTPSPQWVIDIANSIKAKISIQSGSSIQKILINYTNRNEIENRKRIKDSAMSIGGFTSVIEYNPNDIDEEFREKNKQILETVRGGGLWLWKPYFILKTLNTMNENDILVYLDCDMYFISPIDTYIDFMKDKSMMITQIEDVHLEKKYTKMDIFVELKCENNKEITDTAQLTTSPSIWKKTQNTIDFVKLWLEHCENYHLLSDEPSNAPNFPEFIDNRHDQSLLSSLAKLNKDKYNILIERCAIHYCNDTRNPSLPELVAAQ